MPITFPSSPTQNQQVTTGGRTWSWNGEAWELVGSGIAGPTGAIGPAGAGVSLNGSVTGIANLPASNNTPGDAYIVTANGNLYVWSGSAWNSAGQIVGPTGAQGAASTGPTGSAGSTGPTGAASGGVKLGLVLALT